MPFSTRNLFKYSIMTLVHIYWYRDGTVRGYIFIEILLVHNPVGFKVVISKVI